MACVRVERTLPALVTGLQHMQIAQWTAGDPQGLVPAIPTHPANFWTRRRKNNCQNVPGSLPRKLYYRGGCAQCVASCWRLGLG